MTITSAPPRPATTPTFFGSLPVGEPIARALAAAGYSTPTPIQEQVIPLLRTGRDVLGQAQTGTGKTAGFGIPLVEAMVVNQRAVQALILVPTRELCMQVATELARLGEFRGVRVVAVYGGVGLMRQIEALARGPHVVVGTPGRVEDLLARRALILHGVRFAVLDEADRLLDVGFRVPIERILGATPSTRQTALFSATMPDEVLSLAQRQMRDPITVTAVPEQATVDAIEQRIERIAGGDKLRALQTHLDAPGTEVALIFRRTTHTADRLTRDLERLGYRVAVLHGRRSQGQRTRVLAQLKAGELKALVATDIAARGLDIAGLTHVFNYDLPDTPETYVHRIGRTGRAGATGVAITLVAPEDDVKWQEIARALARQGQPERRPTPQRAASSPRGRNESGGNRATGAPQRGATLPPQGPSRNGRRPRRGESAAPRADRSSPHRPTAAPPASADKTPFSPTRRTV